MSSIPPSPSNAYLIQADTYLDPPTLNAIFSSIHARIVAREAEIADWQAAIDALNNLNVSILAENLGPAITEARGQIEALEAQAAELADVIAEMLQGTISATDVSVTAIPGLVGANVQAALANLAAQVSDLDDAVLALIDDIDDALAAKANTSDVAASFAGVNAALAGQATIVNANAAVVAGGVYFVTSSATRTLTLPAAPTNGNRIVIFRSGANNVVVARNGKTIAGLAENLDIDIDKTAVTLTYVNNDWKVVGEKYA